jgi:hypothetical protein
MLSEQKKKLLTAFVDGELGPQQRKVAVRLLHRSAQARKLLSRLKKDSRRLKGLPRQAPPQEFSEKMLQQIAQRPAPVPATPAALAPAATPIRAVAEPPQWIGLVLAASVLVAITTASFWYFAGRPVAEQPGTGPMADKGNQPEVKPAPVVKTPEKPKPETPPKAVPPRLQLELAKFNSDTKAQKALAAELAKEVAVRFDMSTKYNDKTIPYLESAFAQNGVTLLVNAKVKDRIKEGTKALLFAEDLTANQVGKILEDLAREQKVKPAFETVLMNAMTDETRTDVAYMLKLDVKDLQPGKNTGKKPLPPLPLPQTFVPDKSGGTGGAKKDGKVPGGKQTANPPAGKQPKQPAHVAVLLAYEFSSGTLASKEIEQFKKARKPARDNDSLQLVIVLNKA